MTAFAFGLGGLAASPPALAAGVASDPARPAYDRVGDAPVVPEGASSTGDVADSKKLSLTVVLTPRDPDALAAFATQVSTPGTAAYGHYLDVAGFRARFAPTDEQIAAVQQTLSDEGLSPGPVSANGLSIPVTTTAGDAADAFDTSIEHLRLGDGSSAYANTQAPKLPADVADSVQAVLGLDNLEDLEPQTSVGPAASERTSSGGLTESTQDAAGPAVGGSGPQPCAAATNYVNSRTSYKSYTADQLASTYGFPTYYDQSDFGAGQRIALFELSGAPTAVSDVAAYQSCYGTSANVSYISVDNASPTVNQNNGATEVILDIDAVIGLAPQAGVDVYVGPNSGGGAYDTFSKIITDDQDQLISVSWGSCESGRTQSGLAAYNTLFQQAAAQGQSVLISSGDDGAAGCRGSSTISAGDWASLPFATSVGGTSLTATNPVTETAWNGSGGGISRYWSMPTYQSTASGAVGVIGAASTGTTCNAPSGYCRQEPDVAADANPNTGYTVYIGGAWGTVGGTSASTPLWASMLALVNASDACDGRSVGFANPLLYQVAGSTPAAFRDVTSGSDKTGTYSAAPGYDLVTGLGVPSATALGPALCGARGTAVSVSDPGAQDWTVQSPVSLTVQATDGTSEGGLSYTATGLPAGLSIAAATGVISGTPTTATIGAVPVRVTARDTDGYTGDVTFAATVSRRAVTAPLAVLDAGSGAAWSGHEYGGATAYPTLTLQPGAATPAMTPTGTVTYRRYDSADCAGTPVTTQVVTVDNSGAVPQGATGDPLGAGAHAFGAAYSGDATFAPVQSCTPFSVTGSGAPAAAITAPGSGGVFAIGQVVATRFVCAAADPGSSLATCSDGAGARPDAGHLDTSTSGSHVYTVTATAADGQQSLATMAYTVAEAPAVTIDAPVDGASYAQGSTVAAAYGCAEGPGGPGLRGGAECQAPTPAGTAIDTAAAGTHRFSVTSVSADGQQTVRTVTYQVTAATPGAVAVSLSTPSHVGSGRRVMSVVTVGNPGDTTVDALAGLVVPSRVRALHIDGARQFGRILQWRVSSLAPGASVTFRVLGRVLPHSNRVVRWEAVAVPAEASAPEVDAADELTTPLTTLGAGGASPPRLSRADRADLIATLATRLRGRA